MTICLFGYHIFVTICLQALYFQLKMTTTEMTKPNLATFMSEVRI